MSTTTSTGKKPVVGYHMTDNNPSNHESRGWSEQSTSEYNFSNILTAIQLTLEATIITKNAARKITTTIIFIKTKNKTQFTTKTAVSNVHLLKP